MKIITIKHPYLDRFSNSYVINTADGGILIDTGLRSGIDAVREAAPQPAVVLSTHGHWDHMGGTSWFQKNGATVYVHPADAHIMEDLDLQWKMLYSQFENDFDIPPARRTVYVEDAGESINDHIDLHDGQLLEAGDIRLKVIEAPGHSDGSVCYYAEEEGILFTGDVVSGAGFYGGLPQINDIDAYRKTLKRLKEVDVSEVYSCHTDGVMDREMYRSQLAEGLDCFDRLEQWTGEFLQTHRDEDEIRLSDVAGAICSGEGGKAGGSGALIAAAACLRKFSPKFENAARCCGRYML